MQTFLNNKVFDSREFGKRGLESYKFHLVQISFFLQDLYAVANPADKAAVTKLKKVKYC